MGLIQQPLSASKLGAAQTSIQAGGDGVREGVETMLTAMAEYLENGDTGGANGSQVHPLKIKYGHILVHTCCAPVVRRSSFDIRHALHHNFVKKTVVCRPGSHES